MCAHSECQLWTAFLLSRGEEIGTAAVFNCICMYVYSTPIFKAALMINNAIWDLKNRCAELSAAFARVSAAVLRAWQERERDYPAKNIYPLFCMFKCWLLIQFQSQTWPDELPFNKHLVTCFYLPKLSRAICFENFSDLTAAPIITQKYTLSLLFMFASSHEGLSFF